jgi:hypothetical protein
MLFPTTVDLLKNKSQPEAAANGAAAWVISERELRERLRKEKEARELKEKLDVSIQDVIDVTGHQLFFSLSPRTNILHPAREAA